jgi:hypothetical protein
MSADNGDLSLEAHRFSNEAFGLAKEFVAADDGAEAIKERAREYQARLPTLTARLPQVPEAKRAAIAKTLSDARLDLSYILADGNVPSSTRLHFYLEDQKNQQPT